ncbi:hypothetical protein CRYUN_Cryun23aG0119700 [Craigia yunnanensis]
MERKEKGWSSFLFYLFCHLPFPPTKTCCVAENSRFGQALGTSSMFIHAGSNIFLEMSLVEALNVTLFAVDHNLHSSERSLDILNEFRKVRDIEEHVTAMDMPQKENIIIKSNIDQKMTGEANGRMSLKVHEVWSTDSDQGFFTFVNKPPFNRKSHLPLVYYGTTKAYAIKQLDEMRNKKGYKIIQPITNEDRFSNYYCYYLFWVAVGYYLWKKILIITGFRFHPTDFELIHHYLHNKNLGRDALVQAIAEVEDICGLEPWELPGHSNIHSGDQVWYFFYRPNYKYRNSTRIKRTTNEGYWKPTGNPRKIMARDLETEIGQKRTLVFYKGRVSDNNKNKTGWIMHEYELTATHPNQTTFVLCKLKKKYGKAEFSCIEEGQSSYYLPPNLGNYIANNAIPAEVARCLTDRSDPNELLGKLELEVFNEHEGLEYPSTKSWNSYLVGDCPKNEGSDLPCNLGNHFTENAIPNYQLLAEVPIEHEVPQNQSSTNEQDSNFGKLDSAAEKSNQYNLVIENDGSTMPCNSKNATAEDSVQMDLANLAGKSTDELFAELDALPEVQGNGFRGLFDDWISEIFQEIEIPNASYNQSSTNEEQNLTATNGCLSFEGTVESPRDINPSRKSINSNSDIVGYRFHPTDKELVDHYLWNKILDRDSLVQAIKEVDGLFNKDPRELPRYSEIKSADQVWYFFSRRQDNKRVSRTTDKGFWKVTGKARNVKGKRGSAVKKTLVFYEGRTPNAKWTPWVIHEYTFTSTVLDNKEGIFLCKLKNKEDEKADTSSSESCQPSQVADNEIPENSTMFNPDEMLATLEEPDGRDEAENNFSHAEQLLMHENQMPSCEKFKHLYDFSGSYDGVQHLSNSNEQNDESWIEYLVDDDELYPDERSNEQVVENEGCYLPLVVTSMTCPGESSRKRSRFEDGELCGAIENEECQATYEQVVSPSSMPDEHAGSKKHQAMAMVNAPNVTLTAVEHDPHGRERMLSVHNESREMDAPSADLAVDLHCVVRVALAESLDYSFATRFHNPRYQKERSQNLIEQEDDPKRMTKQGKFSGKIVSRDKAIDVKQHATAVNFPRKENAVMESNRKWKTSEKNNGNTSLQMHLNESANIDKKGKRLELGRQRRGLVGSRCKLFPQTAIYSPAVPHLHAVGSRVFTSNIKLWLSNLFLLFLLLASYFGTLDEMNYIKGFRFHPTDVEAMELLWDKIELDRDSIVQVGDSLVQVITQLKDICEFEPWELPGLSGLESGDNIWYFFCLPRYKYRKSNRKNRVTKTGYWKPTGKPGEIVTTVTTYDGKVITGTRQTLVFYKGRVSDKKEKENRTPWVIHELEINLPNQKSLTLCKLKKKYGKVDVSRGVGGQSSHLLPSNLENHCTNNAIPKEQLNSNEPLTEPEAFTEYSGIQSQVTTSEQDDDEFVDSLLINNEEFYSNQPYLVNEKEGTKLSSNSQIHVADNDIPNNQEGFCELINQKPKAPDECLGTLNEVRTSEHDDSSRSSIVIANDQTYSKEGSSLFAENEGSSLAFENHVAVDSIPREHLKFDEFLRNGIFMAELLPVLEEPKNSDAVQNHQFSTNEQDDGFWNSIIFETDEDEDYPEVLRSKQQNLAAKNEGFNFSVGTVELPNDPCPMGLSRKRPRIESEGLTSEADIEAAPALGKKYSFTTEQAQVYSYNKGAFEYDGSVMYN